MSTHSTNRNTSCTRKILGNVTKYIKICCVIKPLQFLVTRNCCSQRIAHMRSLPAHTVGHDLAHMLDSRGLKLIPGFTKHDLDHLILGYGMHPEELCMQAYLIGNGRWQLQVFRRWRDRYGVHVSAHRRQASAAGTTGFRPSKYFAVVSSRSIRP